MPAKIKKRKRGERLTRNITIRADGIRPDAREVDVAFSSQTDEVRGWGGISEILLHEPDAVRLERFAAAGSVLFNHRTDAIVGRPTDVELDTGDRVCRATVVFDADPEADKVFQKVVGGSLRGVSVGFSVDVWRILRANEKWTSPGGQAFTGPLDIAERWTVMEFSLTPVPADGTVGVGRSETAGEEPDQEEPMPENSTPTTGATTATAPAPAAQVVPAVDSTAERARGAAAERARQAEIRGIVALFRDVAGVPELEQQLLDSDATADVARARVMEAVAKQRAAVTQPTRSGVEVGVEERTKYQDAARAWCNLRVGKLRDKDEARRAELETGARQLGVYSLFDLARECVRRAGLPVTGTRDQIIARAFSHTSSDFPNILEAAANKVLLQHWEEAPQTFGPLCKKVTATDFKAMPRYALGDAGLLELLPDGGQMAEGTVPESKMSYSIATYAKRFGITRQTIINDDMSALDTIPALHGAAAKATANSLFWTLLTSASGVGPTMAEDSVALFGSHTSGSNYDATTGTPDNVAHVARAKAKMRNQKGRVGSGETARALNIVPKMVVVPTTLEVAAAQFFASLVDPAKNNSVPNPFANTLPPIVEPLLDGATNGTTAWYLAADPNVVPGAEVAYLDGREEPNMVQVEGTTILGIEWGVFIDVGFAFVGHRGWYRCKGA